MTDSMIEQAVRMDHEASVERALEKLVGIAANFAVSCPSLSIAIPTQGGIFI